MSLDPRAATAVSTVIVPEPTGEIDHAARSGLCMVYYPEAVEAAPQGTVRLVARGTDLKLDPDTFDLIISDTADLDSEGGFDTALLTALLTDRRADASQVPDPTRRRGWMGDLNNPFPIGSYWWLSDSSRRNTRVMGEFISETKGALQPRLLDGSAKSIEVTGEIPGTQGIILKIVITPRTGEAETHYVPIWKLTGGRKAEVPVDIVSAQPPVTRRLPPASGKSPPQAILTPGRDTDLRLDPDTFDLIISDTADLEVEGGFDTALLTALLTDRRADASQVPDPTRRRGWMGDLNNPFPIGSYWWLSDSSRRNTRTVAEFVGTTRDALQPRFVDGSAKSIEVTGQVSTGLGIALTIVIESPTGEVETRYVAIWELTGDVSYLS